MQTQKGISLIEILVSMVLGLLLVGGIGQLFVQSQKSFSMQRNLSDMTDDGAFVLEILAKGLLQAGFAEDGDTSGADGLSYQADATPFSGSAVALEIGQYIKGTDNEIIYRYKLSNKVELDNFLCTSTDAFIAGANVGEMITARIYVQNDSQNIPVLYCKVKSPSQTPNAEPLVSEVYKMIVKYGIRTANDGLYYTDAATLNANGEWNHVVVVKIFLVLRSSDNNLTRKKVTYYIEGVAQPAVPDRRLYKVFAKTIYLRAPDH